jgi:hypothetical protein
LDISDRVARAVNDQFNAPLAVLGVTAEPQDLSVVYHIGKTSFA